LWLSLPEQSILPEKRWKNATVETRLTKRFEREMFALAGIHSTIPL